MLALVPTDVMSSEFAVTDNGQPIAWIEVSSLTMTATLVVDQVEYQVGEGPIDASARGTVLSTDSGRIAYARKRGIFRQSQQVVWGDRTLQLRYRLGGGGANVFENERAVGWIARDSSWGMKASAELPPDVPPLVKAFTIALVLLRWKYHG